MRVYADYIDHQFAEPQAYIDRLDNKSLQQQDERVRHNFLILLGFPCCPRMREGKQTDVQQEHTLTCRECLRVAIVQRPIQDRLFQATDPVVPEGLTSRGLTK